MKSVPSYIYVLFLGLFLTLIIVIYFSFDFKQNEETLFLNETIATYVPKHVDLGMARVQEQLFLDNSEFEVSVRNEVSKKYPGASVEFDYLKESNGALKGLIVTLHLEDKHYTSTYKLSEI